MFQFNLKHLLAIMLSCGLSCSVVASGYAVWRWSNVFVVLICLGIVSAGVWRRRTWIGLCGLAVLLPVVLAGNWSSSTNWEPECESGWMGECSANFDRIWTALRAYHQVYDSLPPACTADEHGTPMHSWRVLILPYLGHQEIYDLYDFTEPWNSPHNRSLAGNVLDVYTCPIEDFRRTSGELKVSGTFVLDVPLVFRQRVVPVL